MKPTHRLLLLPLFFAFCLFSSPNPTLAEGNQHSMGNPCAAKGMNPCAMGNPCGLAAMNPCSMEAKGAALWADKKLSGDQQRSCLTCHQGGQLLNLDKVGPFPHYVSMPKRKVTLEEMINFCMQGPMKAKPFPKGSMQLNAMAAYYPRLVKEYKMNSGQPKKANMMGNPCAMHNPCAR
ncbi:MAG: hypothetical protein RRB13_05640 [bacterium]|nr:hypothetical protein [bacterium]